jgi:serine/threonine protein kinase
MIPFTNSFPQSAPCSDIERVTSEWPVSGEQSRGRCSGVRLPPQCGHEELMSDHSGRLSLVGRALAHYRINTAIGGGGMGEVYRATDSKLGRKVALKVLPPDMARDPERLARFQREARAVAEHGTKTVVSMRGCLISPVVLRKRDRISE